LIATYQGGAINPFIRDTTLVRRTYFEGMLDPVDNATPVVWINEIHYDNASTDADEGVELAGAAGIDLNGWEIRLYNGNGGDTYSPIGHPSGLIPDQQNGYGTVWVPLSGMQNGAPDGIALIDPNDTVVSFLSYEGKLTATGGKAVGLTSTDIGVSESSATNIGSSLQLTGTGFNASFFTWSGPSTHSRGNPNSNQTFLRQALFNADTDTLHFGVVDTGALRDSTLAITNNGNDTLRINALVAGSDVFTSLTPNLDIVPGGTSTTTLRFAPEAGGPIISSLLIFSNGTTSPDTTYVSGWGVTRSLVVPSDTSTINFSAADSTRFTIKFTGGTIAGKTISLETSGTIPAQAQSVPFSDPLIYFVISIDDTTSFSADIVMEYTQRQILSSGISDETFLTVAYFDSAASTWQLVSTTRDTAANTVTFSTNHFSVWALAAVGPAGIDGYQEVAPPRSFSLRQNFPNPFNPNTTIAYEVPEQTHITLTIYNLLGQEVVRLVDQVQAAGRYEVAWHGVNSRAAGVASGIYMYRITSGSGYTETRRMTLLK